MALHGIELGASTVHDHNDEPMFTADGVHAVEPCLAAWRPVLDRRPDALLHPTTAAGARGIRVEDRWAQVEELARVGGMTLVDPGSVDVGLTTDGTVPPAAADGPYQNSHADLDHTEPSGLPWSVAVLGGDAVGCGRPRRRPAAAGTCASVWRTGAPPEDGAGPGEPGNADLLRAAVALVERLGRTPATIRQACAILGIRDVEH